MGAPAFPAGHNGFAAWGVTAGLVDNCDLFLEEVGPDGRSVRQGDGFVPCEVREEVIRVKGKPDVVEQVMVTPRGQSWVRWLATAWAPCPCAPRGWTRGRSTGF